jgi:hypothetical protein
MITASVYGKKRAVVGIHSRRRERSLEENMIMRGGTK